MKLNVLLPLDFSPANEVMYKMVERLCSRVEVRVTLLHVVNSSNKLLDGKVIDGLQTQAGKALEVESAAAYFKDCETDSILLPKGTSPAREIAKIANEGSYDLILTSHRFRKGVGEYLLGSTLSKLIRLSNVPILVLTPGHLPKLGRMLFATDFSPEAVKAFLFLVKTAKQLGATAYAARINTAGDYCTERDFKEHCRDTLQVVAENDMDVHLTVKNFINYNDRTIPGGIINCAQDLLADMIVMATHARSGFNLLMNGSVTQEVLEATHMPVLIYKIEQVEMITGD